MAHFNNFSISEWELGRWPTNNSVDSDKMLDADFIIQSGHGGCFLEDPLTLEMLRSGEFFTTGCFDRLGEHCPNRFENSLLARAHQRVEELLSTHTPAVPEHVVEEIHRWAVKKCDIGITKTHRLKL